MRPSLDYAAILMAFVFLGCPANGQGNDASTQQATIVTASDQPSTVKSTDTPVPGERYPRYQLRPSDIIEITFPISPEFNQTVTLQPDGYISLRDLGDLYVQGQTVPKLTEMLYRAYGSFLHDPVINVELRDFEKPYFIASGQFGHPGKYELRDDTTVAEAVAIAGGFTEKAKHSEVIVFRRTADGWSEAKRIDVKRMLASRNLGEDIHIRPGDLVYVPQNKLSKIHSLLPGTGLGLAIP